MIRMSPKKKDYDFVLKNIKSKTYAVLSTISPKFYSHSSGILYGVSSSDKGFFFYILSDKRYVKVRNISINSKISIAIPFPRLIRFIPPNTITFQGNAEILPFSTIEAVEVFKQNRILRRTLNNIPKLDKKEHQNHVFLKIKPHKKINCFGVGISLLKLMKDETIGAYSVNIPE